MDILVFTETYQGDPTFRTVLAMNKVFEQNTKHTYSWLVMRGGFASNHTPEYVAHLNHARKIMLKENYDALLVLESDILLCSDTIEKLAQPIIDGNADITVAPYRSRIKSVNHTHIVLFKHFEHIHKGELTGHEYNLHVSYRMDALNDYYKAIKWGAPFKVDGAGLGVALIDKRVFKDGIVFWGEDMSSGVDITFFSDCYEKYKTLCIPMNIGHIDRDGIIYWMDDEEFYKELVDKNIRGEMLRDMMQGLDTPF